MNKNTEAVFQIVIVPIMLVFNHARIYLLMIFPIYSHARYSLSCSLHLILVSAFTTINIYFIPEIAGSNPDCATYFSQGMARQTQDYVYVVSSRSVTSHLRNAKA